MAQRQTQLSIKTPELVALAFSVAGLGSRALAVLVDYFLQGVVFVAGLFFLALMVGHIAALNHASHVWLGAAFLILPFLLHWGYFTLFEALWQGRTPGKRMLKLRVIEESGRPITFFESLSRNFLRVVDALPLCYGVGAISMMVSRRQQRLGDLAAGTLVVHEMPMETPMWGGAGNRTFTAAALDSQIRPEPVTAPSTISMPAIARLSKEDLRVIESFLARRLDLPLSARAALAEKLAGRMCSQMGVGWEAPREVSTETFLEQLAAARRGVC